MEILRFENAPTRKTRSKSPIKGLVGLSAVAALAVFGSTLAASITLNSGTVEFGQGVSQTTACDDAITVAPAATFTNAAGVSGVFKLTSITLSDISSNCSGDIFTLQAYGDTNATAVNIATVSAALVNSATVGFNTATSSRTVSAGFTLDNQSSTALRLNITTPAATSGAIYKITLQSGN